MATLFTTVPTSYRTAPTRVQTKAVNLKRSARLPMGRIEASLMVNQSIQFNLAVIHAFSELRLINFPVMSSSRF